MRGLLLTPGGLGPGLRGDPNPATRGGSSWRSVLPCEGGPGGRCPLPAGKLSSEPWRMELIKIGPRALSPPQDDPRAFLLLWLGRGGSEMAEGGGSSEQWGLPSCLSALEPEAGQGKAAVEVFQGHPSLLRFPGVAPFELSTRHSGPPFLTSKSRPGTAQPLGGQRGTLAPRWRSGLS